MKSSTYSSLVTIVFLLHKDDISRSIESIIRTTDKLCSTLELENDLSHMTKYRIISDLIRSSILVSQKTNKNKKIRLSENIKILFKNLYARNP